MVIKETRKQAGIDKSVSKIALEVALEEESIGTTSVAQEATSLEFDDTTKLSTPSLELWH